MKRIILFIVTNITVLSVMSIGLFLFNVDNLFVNVKLNLLPLLMYSFIVGFFGSIISLFASKVLAKWLTNAQVIHVPVNTMQVWLVATITYLSQKAGIITPEIAIYEGTPNAFATGAFQNAALIAVSTELLLYMNKQELEAILAHEISHIANGDMVTMSLIQGVVNTFVIFFARLVGYLLNVILRRSDHESVIEVGYTITVFFSQIFFGIGASIIVAWFSRRREFRADAGSAQLLGSSQPMINALMKLSKLSNSDLPKSMVAFGVNHTYSFIKLFSTHPSLELRIAALRNLYKI